MKAYKLAFKFDNTKPIKFYSKKNIPAMPNKRSRLRSLAALEMALANR